MVRALALDMVNGHLGPCEGSRRIWWDAWEELGRPNELSPFVALATDTPVWNGRIVLRGLAELPVTLS